MSNSLAIAAVTATIRNLLTVGIATDSELNDTTITMQPLDRARPAGGSDNQLNIFLYQTLPNAALAQPRSPRPYSFSPGNGNAASCAESLLPDHSFRAGQRRQQASSATKFWARL